MPTIKTETIGDDSFPNKKHSFAYNYNTKSGCITAALPPWMQEALGQNTTEPKGNLEEAQKELRRTIEEFASRETRHELVIAVQYSDTPSHHFDDHGLMIGIRARLMTRTTTMFRGGEKQTLSNYDFRIPDPAAYMGSRFEDERHKAWKRLDASSHWNVRHQLNVHILPHTPELEAYILRLADAIQAAQERLNAIFTTTDSITAAVHANTPLALMNTAPTPSHDPTNQPT